MFRKYETDIRIKWRTLWNISDELSGACWMRPSRRSAEEKAFRKRPAVLQDPGEAAVGSDIQRHPPLL